MPLYEITKVAITEIEQTTFADHDLDERFDLQHLLRESVEIIAPGTLVIAEELCEWDQSKRRIDLLAIDSDANLIVIELKRTEDGGHMELQAIRYAAMISTMSFSQAVGVYGRYLKKRNIGPDEAENRILKFLDWDTANEKTFGEVVRIVLVSADFSKEIPTSVFWLNKHDLDITCVRLRPYIEC